MRTSTDPDTWAADSIKALRRKIVEIITKDERLKHIRDPIPANWLSIKNQVSDLARQRSVLPRADLSTSARIRTRVPNPSKTSMNSALCFVCSMSLARSSRMVWNGRQRPQDGKSLCSIPIGAYRVLDKASSVHQGGEFLRHDLAGWLDPGPYPPERHEFILDMMQDEDIGLCFRLPIQKEERYLVPEAMPANTPYLRNWPKDCVFAMSIIICRPVDPAIHCPIQPESDRGKSRGRTGVVLKACDCPVLVRAYPDQRRVDIEVDGPLKLRRAALNIILNDLEAVHKLNPEAEPEGVVPVPDRSEKHVNYKHLLMLEQKMGSDYEFIPDGADRAYQVGELLEGVRRDEPVRIDDDDKNTKVHVVILIHSIRTRALLQNELRKTLKNAGFVVQPTNYEYYDLFRFLFPWQPFAGSVVSKIAKQVSYAMDRNDVKSCSIIAHSFGTFVVARMLRDHDPLKFDRIIFCGSVVPQSFPIEKYGNRFNGDLVNEVGTRDFWPVFAEGITFGYGSAGTYGFRRPAVRDRWHNGKAHSDFLTQDF